MRLRTLFRPPNLLSFARLPLAFTFPFVADRPVLAFGVLAGAGISDVLDGWLARRLRLVSDEGAVVDPIADKIFAATVVATLVGRGALSIYGAGALLTRELFETPLVLWCAAQRRRHPACARAHSPRANALGKAATVLQFAAFASAVALPPARRGLIVTAAALGIAAGVGYWVRELRGRREAAEVARASPAKLATPSRV